MGQGGREVQPRVSVSSSPPGMMIGEPGEDDERGRRAEDHEVKSEKKRRKEVCREEETWSTSMAG